MQERNPDTFWLAASKPQYTSVWDVEIVLNHIKNMPPRPTELAGKLAMLMALTNADRASDLHLLDLNLKRVYSHQIVGLSKTRRSGPLREVAYSAFKECEVICLVATLEVYECHTADLRATDWDANPLFIGYVKPHKPVMSTAISRWVRNLMQVSGINVLILNLTQRELPQHRLQLILELSSKII